MQFGAPWDGGQATTESHELGVNYRPVKKRYLRQKSSSRANIYTFYEIQELLLQHVLYLAPFFFL